MKGKVKKEKIYKKGKSGQAFPQWVFTVFWSNTTLTFVSLPVYPYRVLIILDFEEKLKWRHFTYEEKSSKENQLRHEQIK